jgi:hypothetical protein
MIHWWREAKVLERVLGGRMDRGWGWRWRGRGRRGEEEGGRGQIKGEGE